MPKSKIHSYQVHVTWTGNLGKGTPSYLTYSRDHQIRVDGKPTLFGSSDPAFQGDPSRYNPEELLVASLSSCHMLWYLHLCAQAGVVVEKYEDNPIGYMIETSEGGGQFQEVTLHPKVHVSDRDMINMAQSLHQKAHSLCFIARSVNFPVHHSPTCQVANNLGDVSANSG